MALATNLYNALHHCQYDRNGGHQPPIIGSQGDVVVFSVLTD